MLEQRRKEIISFLTAVLVRLIQAASRLAKNSLKPAITALNFLANRRAGAAETDPRSHADVRSVKPVMLGSIGYYPYMSPVLDQRVYADVMKYEVPAKFDETMKRDHRDPEVFQYKHIVIHRVGIHSAWFLTFFERTMFVGIVSMSPDGFKELTSNESRVSRR